MCPGLFWCVLVCNVFVTCLRLCCVCYDCVTVLCYVLVTFWEFCYLFVMLFCCFFGVFLNFGGFVVVLLWFVGVFFTCVCECYTDERKCSYGE